MSKLKYSRSMNQLKNLIVFLLFISRETTINVVFLRYLTAYLVIKT